jgi:hypothetical protein
MSLNPIQIQRDILHNKLKTVPGIKEVYFQPPSTKKLEYPCIVYQFEGYEERYGNNSEYLSWPKYSVTVIDHDVESMIPRYMKAIRGKYIVSLNRFFVSDNLNHWVFNLVHMQSISVEEDNNG